MNLDNGAIPIIGRKQKFCEVCGQHAHPFNTRCDYQTLVKRIKILVAANSAIPGVLLANKEATGLAQDFRKMANDTAQAMVLVEQVVMRFENGTQIWKQFQEELEKKWPRTSSPGISETPENLSPKSTIPSATESKPSTEETQLGETIAPNSSRSTPGATRAENGQLL